MSTSARSFSVAAVFVTGLATLVFMLHFGVVRAGIDVGSGIKAGRSKSCAA